MLYTILLIITLSNIVDKASSSLFRSSDGFTGISDWHIEAVRVIPLDLDVKHNSRVQSYLIQHETSSNRARSFIIDLRSSENFNHHVPIEYDRKITHKSRDNCTFHTGVVRHLGEFKSMVAMSSCTGLAGLIHHTDEKVDYILEPSSNATNNLQHILMYHKKNDINDSNIWSCNVPHEYISENHYRSSNARRQRRSVIRERFIETLLVADASVSEFFANDDITELYLLTMMNMVNSIYSHFTLGYPVEIVLTRIMILNNQSNFQMASKASETLERFCLWQEQLKKPDKARKPMHHDVAVFLTRKSLCRHNSSCSTIGLAHMSGMCMVNRSCNINQDIGLISAYTIAHEIGHNLGMYHDGEKGHCVGSSRSSESNTIMLPSYSRAPNNMWSQCSRDNLTEFFDQGWGKCLNNRPVNNISFDDVLPGIIFDLDEQCRLAVGPHSRACFIGDEPPMDVCSQMTCIRVHEGRSLCVSTMANQPADGTLCGKNKWCLHGKCTPMNYRAEMPPVHGNWSPWTPWSECSHTCGLGVEYQFRTCTNPKPAFGGKHCLGTRKRYRTCQNDSCVKDKTNQTLERQLSCEDLNRKSNGTKWKTVSWVSPVPCIVFCTPIVSSLLNDNDQSNNSNVIMQDDEIGKIESIKVRDGTLCSINDKSYQHPRSQRGICIAGQCLKLGCDNQLYSNAVEDECGICNGNRTFCQQVQKVLQYKRTATTPAGSYVKIGTIAKGLATFQVEKPTQSNSFLAIKVKDRYYLNGNRSISGSSDFQIGGTYLTYRRNTKKEVLDGNGKPLSEDIDIMILTLNSDLIQIKYSYWQMNNKTKVKYPTNFYQWTWENETDDDCLCEHRQLLCTFLTTENERIVVSDHLCDMKKKTNQSNCNTDRCFNKLTSAPRWQIGVWRPCEGRCWPNEAVQRRSVLCVRTLPNNRTHGIPFSICQRFFASIPIMIRDCPANESFGIPNCTTLENYSYWVTGDWIGNCSSKDHCAIQKRTVTCVSHDSNSICTADERAKPADVRLCDPSCGTWLVSHWSNECLGTCEKASITRKVWCSASICDENTKPSAIRSCILSNCVNDSIYTTQSTTTLKMTTTSTRESTSESSLINISKIKGKPSKIEVSTKNSNVKNTTKYPVTKEKTKKIQELLKKPSLGQKKKN